MIIDLSERERALECFIFVQNINNPVINCSPDKKCSMLLHRIEGLYICSSAKNMQIVSILRQEIKKMGHSNIFVIF